MPAKLTLPLPEIDTTGCEVIFGLDAYCAPYAPLRVRSAECVKVARFALREFGKARYRSETGVLVLAWPQGRPVPLHLPQKLLAPLLQTACRPLTPREVRAALGISNEERLRWTRDGRLRRSNNIVSTTGRRVAPTYTSAQIQEIARSPAILELWREADEKEEASYGR